MSKGRDCVIGVALLVIWNYSPCALGALSNLISRLLSLNNINKSDTLSTWLVRIDVVLQRLF